MSSSLLSSLRCDDWPNHQTLLIMRFWPKPLWLKVFFSNRYVYAQVARKEDSTIVTSASTIERTTREALAATSTSDRDACAIVAKLLSERCKERDISTLHFKFKDGQKYQGKLKVLLNTLIEGGVQIRH